MQEKKVWYEPHPVTPARKAELVGLGYQIIDAAFAPAGHENPPDVDARGLRTDGPTIDEFVEAGYPASNYPPYGYASRSEQSEIDADIAAQADVAALNARDAASALDLSTMPPLAGADAKGVQVPEGAKKAATVAELREALAAKGVEVPEGAKKADLQALLDAAA